MIPAAIQQLGRAARAAPSPDNSQPWRLLWDDIAARLSLRLAPERCDTRVFSVCGHALGLTMGAVMENIQQAATAMGLDLRPEFPPCEGESPVYARYPIDRGGMGELPAEHPLFQRHTNRMRYTQQPLAEAVLSEVAGMEEDECRVEVVEGAADVKRVAGLVRLASSLRFRNRVLHEWFGQTLRFTPPEVDQGDGLDVATFELPPGGRGLLRLIRDWGRMRRLNRLGMYRLLAGLEAQMLAEAPALIQVAGPQQPSAWAAAGRLLERVWIHLNSHGVAVQPYYVLADQLQRAQAGILPETLQADAGELLQQAQQDLISPSQHLHMTLRIGYPRAAPVLARRLPEPLVLLEDTETT